MKRRIIDKRKKEKFMLDDEYLNGQARLCGWQGTIVYNSLCRHANNDQECFPSIKLMAEQHGVSTRTIRRGIKKLENNNVIKIGKKRSKRGRWMNNSYTLLDKSVWIYNQGTNSPMDNQGTEMTSPGDCEAHVQGTNSPTKETHREGNTYKETHTCKTSFAGDNINDLIALFEKVNPSYERLFPNKTQRSAISRLLKKYGREKVTEIINSLSVSNSKEYAPTITTPLQLEAKLGQLVAYWRKKPKQIIAKV